MREESITRYQMIYFINEGRVENINRNRGIWIFVVIIVIATFIGGWYLYGKEEVLAEVNGEKIKKGEFYDRLETEAGKAIFSQMLAEKLIKQAASDADITVSSKEIDEEINQIKAQFGSEELFSLILAQNGLTEEILREQIEYSIYAFKLSTKDVVITEEDAKAYFEKNKTKFDTPEQVRISHILLKTEKEAEEVLEQIKKGDKFEDLVKSKSIDSTTKDNQGDLGYLMKGQMPKEFEEKIFSVKANEVIPEVIVTDDGYHVIKVQEKHGAKSATYEDSKEHVKELLLQEKAKPINEVLTQLKDKAKIVIKDAEYKDLI